MSRSPLEAKKDSGLYFLFEWFLEASQTSLAFCWSSPAVHQPSRTPTGSVLVGSDDTTRGPIGRIVEMGPLGVSSRGFCGETDTLTLFLDSIREFF